MSFKKWLGNRILPKEFQRRSAQKSRKTEEEIKDLAAIVFRRAVDASDNVNGAVTSCEVEMRQLGCDVKLEVNDGEKVFEKSFSSGSLKKRADKLDREQNLERVDGSSPDDPVDDPVDVDDSVRDTILNHGQDSP